MRVAPTKVMSTLEKDYMLKKGYKQTKEWQEKAKDARRRKHTDAICEMCKQPFEAYDTKNIICSKKCRRARNIYLYHNKGDIIEWKVKRLFSTVRLGKDKAKIAYKILADALGSNCKYCGTLITLENASLDHKVPRTGSKVFDRQKKKQIYTDAEIRELDRADNLHIICRPCNQMKGDMTHEQYVSLNRFLEKDPELKQKIHKRLKITVAFFGRHK